MTINKSFYIRTIALAITLSISLTSFANDFEGKNSESVVEQEDSVYKTEISSDFVEESDMVPPAPKSEERPEKVQTKRNSNPIYTAVEQKAMYPGGEAELLKVVNSSIQYPQMAKEQYIQGRVIVRFVVEIDGSVGKVEIVRGKHELLDKEAARVVKQIPKKFKPARHNGEVVRYWYTIPVTFKITE